MIASHTQRYVALRFVERQKRRPSTERVFGISPRSPEVPECALGANGAQCTPQSPNPGGGTNANEALAGGHESD